MTDVGTDELHTRPRATRKVFANPARQQRGRKGPRGEPNGTRRAEPRGNHQGGRMCDLGSPQGEIAGPGGAPGDGHRTGRKCAPGLPADSGR